MSFPSTPSSHDFEPEDSYSVAPQTSHSIDDLRAAAIELQDADRIRSRRRRRWDKELWNIDLTMASALASIRGTKATISLNGGIEITGMVQLIGVDVVELQGSAGTTWAVMSAVIGIAASTDMHHDPEGISQTCLDDILDGLTEEDHPVRIIDATGASRTGTIRAGDYTVAINPVDLHQPRRQSQRVVVAKDHIVAIERNDRLERVGIF